MFGIGGSELVFILFIVLMLFGSEKIPEIARTMGKAIAQIKNATNDIKNEIQNTTGSNDFTNSINSEIANVKSNLLSNSDPLKGVSENFSSEIEQIKSTILDSNQKNMVDVKVQNSSQTKENREPIIADQIDDEEVQNEEGPIKRKR